MPIEDVFSIKGRWTVVTGRVERGVVKVNEEMEIVGLRDNAQVGGGRVVRCSAAADQGQAGGQYWLSAARGSTGRRGARDVLAKPGKHHGRTRRLRARCTS